jgi:hypothetical protein
VAACERCGATFGCRADADAAGCWCRERELPAPARRAIAAAYRDCLCPACLGELANRARES